jgi:hypothetical protein
MWLFDGPNKWHTSDIKPLLGEVVETEHGFCVWRIRLDKKTMVLGRAMHPVAAMDKVREVLNTIDLEVDGKAVC